jgi:hypothetical protein
MFLHIITILSIFIMMFIFYYFTYDNSTYKYKSGSEQVDINTIKNSSNKT